MSFPITFSCVVFLLLPLALGGCGGAGADGGDLKDAGNDRRLSFGDIGRRPDIPTDSRQDRVIAAPDTTAKDARAADAPTLDADTIASCKVWTAGWKCRFSLLPPLLEGTCGDRKITCGELPVPQCTCFIKGQAVGAPKLSYRVGCDRVKDMVNSGFCTP